MEKELDFFQTENLGFWVTHVSAFTSDTTDGQIQTGGTKIRVTIKSFGLESGDVIPSNGVSNWK
jgi:hypothetical protein